MCQFDTDLYPTEKVSWCLYALFVSDAERIKLNCNCEVKLQTHNVAYNLNKNLLTVSALATDKLQMQCLQKTYCMNVNTIFQLISLPNTCEAYSRNIYIPTTVELINSDPNLTLLKRFPGFNMTYINILDY